MTLGGRQVKLPRLRVRDSDGEVPLASFQWAASTDDALEAPRLEAIAAGPRHGSPAKRFTGR